MFCWLYFSISIVILSTHLCHHVLQQCVCSDLVWLHPQQLLTGTPQLRLAAEQVLHHLAAAAAAAAAQGSSSTGQQQLLLLLQQQQHQQQIKHRVASLQVPGALSLKPGQRHHALVIA
jgi:hypothetical protein